MREEDGVETLQRGASAGEHLHFTVPTLSPAVFIVLPPADRLQCIVGILPLGQAETSSSFS